MIPTRINITELSLLNLIMASKNFTYKTFRHYNVTDSDAVCTIKNT